MNTPKLRGLAAALCLLSFAAPSQAQPRGSADFDYFLLSLSIEPSFCALTPRARQSPECVNLTESRYEHMPLTLHGLWPNRARVSVNRQPFHCSDDPLTLSPPVQAELDRAMPGANSPTSDGQTLEQHEWSKHGTCSGMTPDGYFGAAANLAKQADATIGSVLRDQHLLGSDFPVRDLIEAVAAKDPAMAASMVVDCRTPRGGGQALISEIRLTLSKDLQPIPARGVGMGQMSGCPHGMGRLPRVTR